MKEAVSSEVASFFVDGGRLTVDGESLTVDR